MNDLSINLSLTPELSGEPCMCGDTECRRCYLAWHWVGDKLRGGSPIPADGVWLEFNGACVMCESGLHASRNPFDALEYAPGATLCLVECDGIVEEHEDKLVCSRRRIVARMDATELCRYFARMCALSVAHLWPASFDPNDLVLDWLLTGEERKRPSAWYGDWGSACGSAWGSARDSASARASASARDSASAWGGAWNSVRARASAMAIYKKEFTQLVYECFADYLP